MAYDNMNDGPLADLRFAGPLAVSASSPQR